MKRFIKFLLIAGIIFLPISFISADNIQQKAITKKTLGVFKIVLNPIKNEQGKIVPSITTTDRNIKVQIFAIGGAKWMRPYNGSKDALNELSYDIIPYDQNFSWDICKNLSNCADGKYVVNIKFYNEDLEETVPYSAVINLKQNTNLTASVANNNAENAKLLRLMLSVSIIFGFAYLLAVYDFKRGPKDQKKINQLFREKVLVPLNTEIPVFSKKDKK